MSSVLAAFLETSASNVGGLSSGYWQILHQVMLWEDFLSLLFMHNLLLQD